MVTVGMLAGLAVSVVIVAIIVSVGAEILTGMRTAITSSPTDLGQANQSSETITWNITSSGMEGLTTFGDWLPLIALVVVASVIIGLVVTYMGKIA